MPQDYVADEEVLYRGVRRQYVMRDGKNVRISSQAFTDPALRISIDCASLCNNNPGHTQVDPSDYVCRLVTSDVRAVGSVTKQESKVETTVYRVLVEPDPQLENLAHAVIFAEPEIQTKGIFRKLQHALTLIAQWEPGFGPDDNP